MELPLFPLHTVLFPGVVLPLHVFEPRYRALTERCLAEEEPFGVVLLRSGREVGGGPVRLASVGTMAEIRRTSQYADGRFDLVTVGTRRFRLDRALEGREPYLVGEVTPLSERLGDPDRAHLLAGRVGRRFLQYLARYHAGAGDVEVEIEVEIEVDETDAPGAASLSGRTRSGVPLDRGDVAIPGTPAGADTLERILEAARRIVSTQAPIPLSHLLSGLLQVGLPERQRLLESPTAEARLAELDAVIALENDLLTRQLRPLIVDPAEVDERPN